MKTILNHSAPPLFFIAAVPLVALLSGCTSTSSGPLPPLWWDAAHKDDGVHVYEKGTARNAATEVEARRLAYEDALSFMAKRLCGKVSSAGSAMQLRADYAFEGIEVRDEQTTPTRSGWCAWMLVRYPQTERQRVLERLEKQRENLAEAAAMANMVPNDFNVVVRTRDLKTAYREGESIAFEVKPSRPCHLALFVHQSDGTSVALFPNQYAPDSRVAAGQTVHIPDDRWHGFEIEVSPPFGDDVVQVIACTERNAFMERLGKGAGGSPFKAMTRGMVVKGIGESVKGAGGAPQWAESRIVVSTYR